MATIPIVDVSIRDGNQSLWGAVGLRTEQIVAAARLMERVGYSTVDFTSSTHMGIAVRTYQQNPWDMIRLTKKAMPTTPLQFIGTGFRFISWETAGHDFMRVVYRNLIEAGISRFIVLDPMHDTDALLAVAKIVKEEGGESVMAALTYTLSDIHTDEFYANVAAAVSASPYVDVAYLKDPAGLLTADRAKTLLPAIRAKMNGKPLELHSHCTIGLSQFNYMVAAELGIDALHTAAGPLANGTSLPSAQRTVANLREAGHTVDIDDRALGLVCDFFERLRIAEGLPAGAPMEFDASFLRHQIPGGVMTTMKRQLGEIGQVHRMPEVIEEIERVRAELGFPIMVTPFPQIVSAQAFYNVVGKERYSEIPDQVIRYTLGRFGRPTQDIEANIKDRILSTPRAKTIQAEPPALSIDDMRKRHPGARSDEELLLRSVMPEEQVNAMLANALPMREYNPDARPIVDLVRGLVERPSNRHLVVEKENFRLELRNNDEAA